ncbi:unnamed protein product [Dicrocoelium dendriticum]|nr:unnamed protein product [Dicrocoelium dendriticum]
MFSHAVVLALLSLLWIKNNFALQNWSALSAFTYGDKPIRCEDYVRSKLCMAPMDRGPCHKRLERYAYDPERNKCVRFAYGGCGGNANNYETVEWCELLCAYPVNSFLAGRVASVC